MSASTQTAEVAPSPSQIAKSTNGHKPIKAKRARGAGRPKSAASTIPVPPLSIGNAAPTPAAAPVAAAPMPTKKGGGKKTMPLAAAPDSLSPTMKRLAGKYPKRGDKTAGLHWLHDAAAMMMETCGYSGPLTVTFG